MRAKEKVKAVRPLVTHEPPPPYDPLQGLSDSEGVFVEHYMKTLDATGAYEAWCDAEHRVPGKQRHTNAYKMLRKLRIQSAIVEIQRRLMENCEITSLKVLNDLEEERKGAIGAQQFAAAIKASELQGKHIGMFNDGYADKAAGPMIIIVSGRGKDEGKTLTIEMPARILAHEEDTYEQAPG